ncbi:MAG: hypothetical protein ACJAYX_001939 [Planctomycetota bacterium]|jgi:hypothetical protein
MTYKYAVFARLPDKATARTLLDTLDGSQQARTKSKLFACTSDRSANGHIAGLMNNSTWAESDVRRGLAIGISIGAVLGTALGFTLFSLLEMPASIGLLLGGMMGTGIGTLMSGIVGAGLVHPRLKQVIKHLELGQAAVAISNYTRNEHQRAIELVQPKSLEFETNR